MQLFLFITLVITLAFGAVHFQNPDATITMKFVTWTFEHKPIELILAISFGIGILAGTFLFVPPWMKKASLARQQKKRILGLESELDELVPAKEEAEVEAVNEESREEIS